MLIGTIDFYRLIPHSVTLTLAKDHKVSAKQHPFASFFMHTFLLIRVKLNVVLKQFKLKILVLLFFSEIS